MSRGAEHIRASRTGDASAESGAVAVSGVAYIGQLVVGAGTETGAEITEEEMREAVTAYTRRLLESYGRIDLEVLTPLSDQGEHPAVELREVFVTPGLRADPPPVSLPRELVKRLTEHGELTEGELPPGVETAQLEQVRAAQQRPVEAALDVLGGEGADRLVVLGDPGAGKTTLVRYLALALTAGATDVPERLSERLPVVVELRRYAEEKWRDATFEDYLEHLHTTEGTCVPRRVLTPLLESGRAVVVFDGLDELFDPARRETVAHRIAGFAARYPQARVLVTSRVIGYARGVLAGAGFTHYMLQDLDESQIAEFARRWYATACPEDPEKARVLQERVTDAVANSRAIAELAGNPLLLTILAIIGRRQTLPRDRQGVYEHAVTVLVAHLDQDTKYLKPRVTPDAGKVLDVLDARELLELLRLLARHMQDGHGGIAGNHIHTTELEGVLRDHLTEQFELPALQVKAAVQALVGQFRDRNFILSHYGGGVYGFVHRAFLEYLAAADIVHRYKEDREWTPDELVHTVFGSRAADPAWHEVLLLVVGQLSPTDAARVVDHFISLHRARCDDRMLALAVRALAEVRKIGALRQQSENVARAFATRLSCLPDVNPDLWEAAPAFSTFGDLWAGRKPLSHWFHVHGQFLPFREWNFTAIKPILASLYQNPVQLRALSVHAPKSISRVAALNLLARTSADQLSRDQLVESAVNDPAAGPRAAALVQLAGGWADGEVRGLLEERAVADPDGGPRAAALRGLAVGWGGEGVRGLLEERAVADPDGGPRAAALEELAGGWADGEVRGLLEERAVADPDGGPRAAALRGLAVGWGDEGVRSLLTERVVDDPHNGPRVIALVELALFWGDEKTRGLLMDRATVDPAPGIRATALLHLASRWGDDGVRSLMTERVVGDAHADPRSAALSWSAFTWGDEAARGLLIERATADPEPRPRSTALRELVYMWADDQVRGMLMERATADPDPEPRATAVRHIAVMGEQAEIRDLLRSIATTDPDPELRLDAVRRVGAADMTASDFLAERLRDDPSPLVREGLAWSLAFGWYEDDQVITALETAAEQDEDPEVRQAATAALAAAAAMREHADGPE